MSATQNDGIIKNIITPTNVGTMNVPGWVFILIHIVMVSVSGTILLFSNNVVVLGIMTAIIFVVFYACVYFDGCITTKAEDPLPFLDLKPTEVIKRVFFVNDTITMGDMEKIMIGLTLAAYIAKFGILLVLKEVYGLSYMRFLSVLATQKNPYSSTLLYLFV